MKIKTLTFFYFFLTGFMVVAQSSNEFFSLGLGIGGTQYYDLGGTSMLNFRAQMKTNEGEGIFLNLNYEVPYSLNYKLKASAKNWSSSIPLNIEVPYSLTNYRYNATVNYLYTITDEEEKPYYFYIFGGFGVSMINNKYVISDYDKDNYKIDYERSYRDADFWGVNFDFGIGANYNWKRLKFFGDAKVALIREFKDGLFESDNQNPIVNTSVNVGVAYIVAE